MSDGLFDYFSQQAQEALMTDKVHKDYSDIDMEMKRNPLDHDILRKTGIASIKQALKNLVLLNHYEKPFNPDLGSDIYRSLFENFDRTIIGIMRDNIKTIIQKYEKRVEVLSVSVVPDDDNNQLDIEIRFKPLDTLIPDQVRFFLQINR